MSKEFYELVRTCGLSIDYVAITETDFAATAGAAYTPSEKGGYRRIDVARSIQLLSDASGVVETFQTTDAELRLPANTVSDATNDAGDGRLFFLKNSGTGKITIKDYQGNTLWSVLRFGITMVVGNDNNNWDFYFKAQNIPHDTISSMESSTNIQTGLEYLMKIFRDVIKEPTGFVNKYFDSVVTFTDLTRTFSIAPLNESFEYYIRGKVYSVTSLLSYQITDTEGLWYFYFDQDGTLQGTQTSWTLSEPKAFIVTGYWDSTNKKWIRDNEERHGTIMDADTHRRMHLVDGAQVQTTYPPGLQITNYTESGDGSSNSHAQYAVTDGLYFDEDLSIEIKNSASPTAGFEQRLSPIAYIPVFYLSDADSWRMKSSTQFPIYENPPALPYYNLFSAGTWSLAPVTDGYFFATWLVYSDARSEPVMTILGQRQDMDVISAVNNNTRASLILPRKFSEEFYFYKKIIWQASTSYTNTPKARIRFVATSTEITPANDRYIGVANYNGNAGAGKYLEFYAGQSSDLSPFPMPESTFIKNIILSTVANSTGTVSLYLYPDLTNQIEAVSLSNQMYIKKTLAHLLSPDSKIVAKVSSGSLNKPALTLFFQTNL